MRKDFIRVEEHPEDETSFVEKFWTKVWEQERGTQDRIGRVQKKDEFRIMAPYFSRLASGARVLDGGCGLGDWTLCLRERGYRVVGMDLSRETVEKLRARFPEAEFIAGDIRHTEFQDSEFDAYFSWGVFEHFESGLQDCVREAFRIVKPGGYLFISVPLDNLRHAFLGTLSRPRPLAGGMRFYQWRLTRVELARELSLGGFEVVEVRPIHKRQGVLRCLHHEFGMPYGWLVTRGLGVLLAPLLPGNFIAHMVLAVARKPEIGASRGS